MTQTMVRAGSKVRSRVLTEISVSGYSVSVLLDWTAAHTLLSTLKAQLESGVNFRLTAHCVVSGSSLSNLPLTYSEARELIDMLEYFVSD